MVPSLTLHPRRPARRDEVRLLPPAHDDGAVIIDLDSLAIEDVMAGLAAAPARPRRRPVHPHVPHVTDVAGVVAAVIAPFAWVGAVDALPLVEPAGGALLVGGWVAMAAVLQRWTTRTRRSSP